MTIKKVLIIQIRYLNLILIESSFATFDYSFKRRTNCSNFIAVLFKYISTFLIYD